MCARHLGIDYGSKRIGLAVSDAGGSIASPLTTLEAGGDMDGQAAAVVAAAEPYGVGVFVVGFPLNMDGSEGPQARQARAFAARLTAHLAGQPDATVRLWDERQTSMEADERMAMTGLTHKKKKRRRDRLAAQAMLQAYLDACASSSSRDGG